MEWIAPDFFGPLNSLPMARAILIGDRWIDVLPGYCLWSGYEVDADCSPSGNPYYSEWITLSIPPERVTKCTSSLIDSPFIAPEVISIRRSDITAIKYYPSFFDPLEYWLRAWMDHGFVVKLKMYEVEEWRSLEIENAKKRSDFTAKEYSLDKQGLAALFCRLMTLGFVNANTLEISGLEATFLYNPSSTSSRGNKYLFCWVTIEESCEDC